MAKRFELRGGEANRAADAATAYATAAIFFTASACAKAASAAAIIWMTL